MTNLSHQTESADKNIYNLGLHEQLTIINNHYSVLRVPGGWIYDIPVQEIGRDIVWNSVFVPFSNEFQNESK